MKTINPTSYVVGFAFNDSLTQVALIRKLKPQWQAGKLNGLGGKIEPGELPMDAMSREFHEESGVMVHPVRWEHFMDMGGNNDDGSRFAITFYATVTDITQCQTREAERIELHDVAGFNTERADCVDNLRWIIPLAVGYMKTGRPNLVTAEYI